MTDSFVPDTTKSELAVPVSREDVTENHYFPSLVYALTIPGASALNAHLIASIRDVRAQDEKGLHRSNHPGLGGWHSQNDLQKDPRFAEITQYVHALGVGVSERLDYHPDYDLRIGTMWAIVNPKGSSNQAHVHPGCLWSGVYYVQAPKNAGDISFTDPRTAHVMNQPKFRPNQKRPKSCWTKVSFTPKPGKMLLFPSWLYHAVAPNLTAADGDESERIIISFNLNQELRR